MLEEEERRAAIPAGSAFASGGHLRIEGPKNEDTTESAAQPGSSASSGLTRLALVSTIQFVSALSNLKDELSTDCNDASVPLLPAGLIQGPDAIDAQEPSQAVGRPKLWSGKYDVFIPRSKPLSPGEILGCTAPQLEDCDALL